MNYPPYDPNDPHAQPTTAGQYPTFNQQPGQPPPPPQFPTNPGQYSQSGQNFPPYPGQYPQNTQPGQFGPPPIQPQQKWYRKTAGIILWLILVFPVGIYLMWRYARWDRKAKWAVTGFFAVYTLFSLIIVSAASGTASQRSTSVQSSTQVASVNPTDTPIPSPTPTPTPSPTTQPVPTKPQVQQSVQQQPVQQAPPPPAPAPPTPAPPPPAPAQLSVSFTGASAVDNSSGSVSVHTLAGAALTISVKYCSGSYADSNSLKGTEYANSAGNYTWSWVPDTKCKGAATAYVTASLNGQSASNSTTFTVS